MPIALYRIDDRLIHGQVVVGWGQPLNLGFIVLVDDVVAESDWEQELYRLGVPPSMDVYFVSIAEAAREIAKYAHDRRTGMVLTGTVQAMLELTRDAALAIPAVNIGGIHHREDRTQKMRYVFLNSAEERGLRQIAALGVCVTAQDVPSASSKSLDELLRGCDS
jgi:mannose/fructose/N-acetylgalactosamine-specific phosphotransferase system component IIB